MYSCFLENGQIHVNSHQFGKVTDFKPERGTRVPFASLTALNTNIAPKVVASVAEAADRQYSFVVVTTKALPDVLPTSELLAPLLSSSYTFPQPAYTLLQNGLGVETDLYQSLTQRKPSTSSQIITTAVYCAANLIGNIMEHPANIVSSPVTLDLDYQSD